MTGDRAAGESGSGGRGKPIRRDLFDRVGGRPGSPTVPFVDGRMLLRIAEEKKEQVLSRASHHTRRTPTRDGGWGIFCPHTTHPPPRVGVAGVPHLIPVARRFHVERPRGLCGLRQCCPELGRSQPALSRRGVHATVPPRIDCRPREQEVDRDAETPTRPRARRPDRRPGRARSARRPIVAIDRIHLNPYQPRKTFDDDELAQLVGQHPRARRLAADRRPASPGTSSS